jgi:hypothetical protein
MPQFPVIVWVCPNTTCGNYYASSSAGDLTQLYNHNLKGEPTFPRSRCPDCQEERVKCGVVIELIEKEEVEESSS